MFFIGKIHFLEPAKQNFFDLIIWYFCVNCKVWRTHLLLEWNLFCVLNENLRLSFQLCVPFHYSKDYCRWMSYLANNLKHSSQVLIFKNNTGSFGASESKSRWNEDTM